MASWCSCLGFCVEYVKWVEIFDVDNVFGRC
ncbi:hypothetical protein swp_4141 [Shewanella piezotolerans WP3]|uniref:Uncharacterized protein n=1 Tax=Shewanella piezotolerans (strain WP3 / JCM 13877) TaxID=225849 RepID=B8CT27_SHEPW|nr:hypothetical protein swp_4141 [Shewanella piezotolerans WP3]